MALRASHVIEGAFAMSHKVDLTKATFVGHIVPPFVCQYLMGVLVQLQGTRFCRLAFLPVAIWFAWRATLVDMSGGDPAHIQANSMLITQMCAISTRTAAWALAQVQYQRHRPVDSRNRSGLESIRVACWNTWDLLVNPRGIGWNWPRGLVPKPRYETDSRVHFVLLSAASCVMHALAFDVCVQSIRAMSPDTFGSLQGGTLFDGSLPLVLELARSVVVSALAASLAYFGVQYVYWLLAIVFVIVFRQHPWQWPPLFDAPWLSTSLGELWGRRWHQLMRDMVLALGGRPSSWLFGRLGGIVGAFLASGIFHDIELRSSGRSGYSVVTIGFWVMNGVGVVLERVWERATGRTVGGTWGRVWMVGWLLAWGIPMVNAYAMVGRFGAMSLVGRFEPSRGAVVLVASAVANALGQ